MPWTLDPPISGDAEGQWATQQDVEDFGDADATIVFDRDNDEVMDPGMMQRGLDDSDSIINGELFVNGFTVAEAQAIPAVAGLLRSASVHHVWWFGMHTRGRRNGQTPADAVANAMSGYEQIRDDRIERAIGILQAASTATDGTDAWMSGGASEGITPSLYSNDVNCMVRIGAWGGILSGWPW